MGFNNYKNPSANFDSFNGTELKVYIKVTTEYDEYMKAKKFELVPMGFLQNISGVEQYSNEPHIAIGFSRPRAIATGDSIVVGSITFAALNKSFLSEVKEVLKKAGIKRIYLDYNEDNELKFGYSEITNINELPLVDIVIIGVKENDKNKKIQKEIKGIRFTQGNSGIGINQIVVQEQYSYMAKEMTDFNPVNGVEEDVVGDEDVVGYIF